MKIFLTGGTGFIGKNFIKMALKKGIYIFATTRQIKISKHKNLKWLLGDFSLNWKELANSDVLVHLAAEGVVFNKNNKSEIFKTNLLKSKKLLKNAIKYGCKKWLIASTSSEYGRSLEKFESVNIKTTREPDNYYALSKFYFTNEAVKLAIKYKCKARIMRIFPVYGKGENRNRLYTSLINAAKTGKNFKIKNPLELRDFSKVEYVCKALIDAINFKKKKFTNYQIWHISENNIMTIKKFSQNVWNDFNGKGKLIFESNYNQNKKRHISLNSSRWK